MLYFVVFDGLQVESTDMSDTQTRRNYRVAQAIICDFSQMSTIGVEFILA